MATQSNNNGIDLFGLLGVLFVGLKLAKVIDWPWVWVLAPFWGPIALLLVILIGVLIGSLLLKLFPKNNA